MNDNSRSRAREALIPTRPARSPRPRGEVAAAVILALGVAVERRRDRSGRKRHRNHPAATAVPIVLVNAIAFYGQLSYLQAALAAPEFIRVLTALALESIAVYLAYQAHLALVADDSAMRLRLAAYGIAAGIGALNYSHWRGPHWHPTAQAITFALCSVISPWLWSVHSRRDNRDALKARGLIEPHAVRLGATRWFWHFAACCQVMFRATWIGETRPSAAIALAGRDGKAKSAKGREGRVHGTSGRPEHPAAAAAAPVPAVPAPSQKTSPPAPARPAPETVLPAPARPAPEPQPRAREAGPEGLAVALSDTEQEMVRALVLDGRPLPAERQFARERTGGSRRVARRVISVADRQLNGYDSHERD